METKGRKKSSYLSQFFQNMFFDAAFLEIDPGTLNNICDDLGIDISDL
jgi:hypothetical protein